MVREGPTEEFVRHYRCIVDKTVGNPDRLPQALDEHSQRGLSLRKLGEIFRQVEHGRKYSSRRYIRGAHPEFRDALRDFKERWISAYNKGRDRMYMQALS